MAIRSNEYKLKPSSLKPPTPFSTGLSEISKISSNKLPPNSLKVPFEQIGEEDDTSVQQYGTTNSVTMGNILAASHQSVSTSDRHRIDALGSNEMRFIFQNKMRDHAAAIEELSNEHSDAEFM